MTRNPYTGACQQRCVYAHALVEAALGEDHAPVLKTAMVQGAVYQVYSAYVQHLREIAESYSCADPLMISSAHELVEAFSGQDTIPPEVTEMINLVSERSSWLAQCLVAYRGFQGTVAAPTNVSHGGIDLFQESIDQGSPDPHKVKRWADAMTELVERHRALMQEY